MMAIGIRWSALKKYDAIPMRADIRPRVLERIKPPRVRVLRQQHRGEWKSAPRHHQTFSVRQNFDDPKNFILPNLPAKTRIEVLEWIFIASR
jgi:hypothetical protein